MFCSQDFNEYLTEKNHKIYPLSCGNLMFVYVLVSRKYKLILNFRHDTP